MKFGWAVVAAGTVLALTGCGRPTTKLQELADCQIKGDAVYPHWREEESTPIDMGAYVADCMIAKGYVDDNANWQCSSGRTKWLTQTDSLCYRKPWPWE